MAGEWGLQRLERAHVLSFWTLRVWIQVQTGHQGDPHIFWVCLNYRGSKARNYRLMPRHGQLVGSGAVVWCWNYQICSGAHVGRMGAPVELYRFSQHLGAGWGARSIQMKCEYGLAKTDWIKGGAQHGVEGGEEFNEISLKHRVSGVWCTSGECEYESTNTDWMAQLVGAEGRGWQKGKVEKAKPEYETTNKDWTNRQYTIQGRDNVHRVGLLVPFDVKRRCAKRLLRCQECLTTGRLEREVGVAGGGQEDQDDLKYLHGNRDSLAMREAPLVVCG
ncbi:uncharacterized protein EI90DRAFT_3022798 [Cantharellus anzutake]|uniref:uncharacterized protein n=1 Tax=Cantharellus anzutake TaxID=1750568 RepID=UPI001907FF86|nr:uncharacterized protein EI90DRAFT_3022798 [Cantharellus anzutake]KAF8313025.1 hypothetical protein EI90DRAFT_3022798 [Cantharellus anzutake]